MIRRRSARACEQGEGPVPEGGCDTEQGVEEVVILEQIRAEVRDRVGHVTQGTGEVQKRVTATEEPMDCH
jgi:hypothetical protein